MSEPDVMLSAPMFMVVLAGPYGANDLSSWVMETSLVGMSRDAVVADIAKGQVEDVYRVIGIDLKNGGCWDATAEIAQEVADLLPCEADRTGWDETLAGWCWQKINRKAMS